MRRRTAASLLAASALGALAAGVAAAPAPRLRPELGLRASPVEVHVFRGGRIVVSPERTLERGELLVVDGRVVAVSERVEAPAGAVEHDLAGRTVLPGFVDPISDYGLAHLRPAERRPAGRGAERAVAERPGAGSWNEAVHAERAWVDAFEPDSKAAAKLRERGVVAVQSARLDGVFRGRGFVAATADGPPAEVVVAPAARPFAAFDKGSSAQEYPSSLMGSIALVRQTLFDARWLAAAQKAGARPEVDRALDALAGEEGPLVFETSDVASLLRAAAIADETGVPFVHVGSGEEWQAIDAVAATGDPVVLPLTFPEVPPVLDLDDELDVSVGALRHWERAPGTAGLLAARGVELAFTGHRLRDDEDFLANLRTAVHRGLEPARALAALTVVPARIAGVGDRLGTLEPGKDASFLVVAGDLFRDDEAELVEVWVAGRPGLDREPQGEADFRGVWDLRLGERSAVLKLRGERTKLRGSLAVGEDSVDLDEVSSAFGRLAFAFPARVLGAEGTVRVAATDLGGEVGGEALLPDGARVPVGLVRRPAGAETSEETAGEGEKGAAGKERERKKKARAVLRETALVSRSVFPNVGFGVETPARSEDVLVRGATLWTLEGEGLLEGADLLVRDGVIVGVGRDLAPPPGARVIDGAGLHVTPGIIDEHSHLAIAGGVNEGSHAVTSEVRIGDVVDPADVGAWRALAGGVTAAQLLHGSANPIGGQAQVVKLRWGRSAADWKVADAPPSIKFALGENVKQSNWGDDRTTRYPQTRMGVETLVRDRFLRARDYAAAWRAWEATPARARAGKAPPRRDLQLEALAEILDRRRHVHCHSYVASEILATMRLAEELGFRISTFTHILEGYKVAPEMAAHGAAASSFADWWAYKFEVYDAIPYNTCLLAKHGVVTSVNSDSEELIRHLNQEAAKSVLYCDMPEVEALKLVTLNPAKQLGIDHRAGSLAVGKDADFVLWNGHPLSTASRAEETWIDGAPVFTRAKDAELRAAVAAERRALVQKALRAGGGREEERGGRRRESRDCDDVEDFWHDGR